MQIIKELNMSPEVEKFIRENIKSIQSQNWEEIYQKEFPKGFTETLLDCGINPLYQGLNYIPKNFLYDSRIEQFIIPNNITSIGYAAFYYCTSLTSITIPNSVKNIYAFSFSNCSSLKNIEIPNSVMSISYNTFDSCNSLINVVVGDNVWSIENEAFINCSNLKNIEIPNSVKIIGKGAFSNCSNLKEIIFKGTKEEAIICGIGEKAFKNWREGSSIEKIICTDGIVKL